MAHVRQVPTQVQQGDVLLNPINTITPQTLKSIQDHGRNLLNESGHAVLALSVTGQHPHTVVGEALHFIETTSTAVPRQQEGDTVSRIVITGSAGATLTHDEHEHISLAPNTVYQVFRQLETLVGDRNDAPAATGTIANDRSHQVQARRYVAD